MEQLWLELLALREAARGQRARLAQRLLSTRSTAPLLAEARWIPAAAAWQTAERQLRALQLAGLRLVPVWELPPRLTRVRPLVSALFVRGEAALLGRPGVAIVGARDAGAAGERWAVARARQAVDLGLTLVSGGARGIDAAAHFGAIGAGGATLAYLGVAADRIYPESNRRLFERLLERGGALVSEHPPGAETLNVDHAKRNRFIAAHSLIVFVVEAALRSGSLGTARFAQRLGVPVEVAPAAVGGKRGGLATLLDEGWAEPYRDDWSTLLGARDTDATVGLLPRADRV